MVADHQGRQHQGGVSSPRRLQGDDDETCRCCGRVRHACWHHRARTRKPIRRGRSPSSCRTRPGGRPTRIARIMAERMRGPLGQTDHRREHHRRRRHASASAGSRARRPTVTRISIGHWSTHVVNGAIYPLQYDVFNDFEPVAMIATNPQLIVARKGLPAKNLKELVAWLKANPAKATQGTAGVGSASACQRRLSAERHRHALPVRAVSRRRPGDAGSGRRPDRLHGRPGCRLAAAGARRHHQGLCGHGQDALAAAPDIPTVDEAGVPGLHISVWHALWMPKGTPKDIIAKLNAAVVEALGRSRRAPAPRRSRPGDSAARQQTPEALAAHHKAEIDKWWPIIKAANIKGE